MKDSVNKWLDQMQWREGFVAWGVRHADRTSMGKARVNGFPTEALESALDCTAELFQLLDRNSANLGRTCLVYKNALLHAERRADGICLAVFTVRDVKAYDSAALEKMFSDFQKLGSFELSSKI
jgi:hypothetical protein